MIVVTAAARLRQDTREEALAAPNFVEWHAHSAWESTRFGSLARKP